MAWLAPFPPQLVSKLVPMTVSPRTGSVPVYVVRSWFADPTTTTFDFMAASFTDERRANVFGEDVFVIAKERTRSGLDSSKERDSKRIAVLSSMENMARNYKL